MGLLQQEDEVTLSEDVTALARNQSLSVGLQQHPTCFQPISRLDTSAVLSAIARSGHSAESLGLQMQVRPSACCVFITDLVLVQGPVHHAECPQASLSLCSVFFT
jgi:hypothetical protein